MTEAEAKAIEFKWADMSDEQKAAAFGHAVSRLLAVEAELGPLEVIHQWARLQPVPIAVDQAMRALDRLRGPAAPPSPPVAPSPVMCRYHVPEYHDPVMGEMHPGTEADCDQKATHISCMPYTGTPTCAEHSCRCAKPMPVAPEPAQENRVDPQELDRGAELNGVREWPASSGEAAGDGVTHTCGGFAGSLDCAGCYPPPTHDEARNCARVAWEGGGLTFDRLMRYIDQQEQAEREAAGLREEVELWRNNIAPFQNAVEETLREALARAESDRDAERTQKEAALLEVSRLSFEFGKARGEADGLALLRKGAEAEREALRVELEEAQAKRRSAELGLELFQQSAAVVEERNAALHEELEFHKAACVELCEIAKRDEARLDALRAENEGLRLAGRALHDQMMLWHGSDDWTVDDQMAHDSWLEVTGAQQPAEAGEMVNWIQGVSVDAGMVAGRVTLNDFAQALADAEFVSPTTVLAMVEVIRAALGVSVAAGEVRCYPEGAVGFDELTAAQAAFDAALAKLESEKP